MVLGGSWGVEGSLGGLFDSVPCSPLSVVVAQFTVAEFTSSDIFEAKTGKLKQWLRCHSVSKTRRSMERKLV